MADNGGIEGEFVHLARVALSGRTQDVQTYLHRIAKRRGLNKEFSGALIELLRKNPTRSSPLRKGMEKALPTDTDSRFQLLRVEETPFLQMEPVYTEHVQGTLSRLVDERQNLGALLEAGLEPTRTVLFTGPPGVGKTMGARWVARELGLPLMILDLSAVMSSYLGRTGSNLRHVLDYAKSIDCVLLLDELDAIAKRRDDSGEIGELKRLVTVLLQQLDDWPSSGLLIAATNHSDLLDPAVWRRFEQPVDFALPDEAGIRAFLQALFEEVAPDMSAWVDILSVSFIGRSYSDIEREVTLARRSAVLNGKGLDHYLSQLVASDEHSKQERIEIAVRLVRNGLTTQRKAHEITGVARDTIRSHLKNEAILEA
ncbi:ATP-binding protein [Leisingera aquaemixtae]|uniref:AAA family ATPase n=1 Tax=Leisingera aquaemixtae TaxID=1396826 RepID=UPI0021A27E77|nr:ATP-binding protein [Leisingera aquaemixtae]UWQ38462.1 ATP-binding protein [Leisingera aquaemixtae]